MITILRANALALPLADSSVDLVVTSPPVVRVHLTAATLDAAAAVCHVRGLPHLVARLDAAATEIRNQTDTPEGNP